MLPASTEYDHAFGAQIRELNRLMWVTAQAMARADAPLCRRVFGLSARQAHRLAEMTVLQVEALADSDRPMWDVAQAKSLDMLLAGAAGDAAEDRIDLIRLAIMTARAPQTPIE